MSRILIVDDDLVRRLEIAEYFSGLSNHTLEISFAGSVSSAKSLLKQFYFPIVLLDMALPQYDGEENVDEDAGSGLLTKIASGRYKKIPNRVVGFTALSRDVSSMEEKFDVLGFKLYVASCGDFTWLSLAIKQIDYTLSSLSTYEPSERDLAVVTVHGILTFGQWQEHLYSEIEEKYSQEKISHLCFKYTRFDIFSFLFPKARDVIVRRFKSDLKVWLENNSSRRIVCFSHSFGTYVLVRALEMLGEDYLKRIDLIVLSGSVLKQNHDFKLIRSTPNLLVVNDCAINDNVLLVSESFVLGMGMAGRRGFMTLSDDRFTNRLHAGGHSGYFSMDSNFIEQYWIPLIGKKADIRRPQPPKDYTLIEKLFDNLANFSSKIKPLLYLGGVGYIIYSITVHVI